MTGYAIIACSRSADGPSPIIEKLKQALVRKYRICEAVDEFAVPDDMKFTSLDNLFKALEDLKKNETQVDTVLRRLERYQQEFSTGSDFFVVASKGKLTPEEFVMNFRWDDSKYPKNRPIGDNLTFLMKNVTKIDEEVRSRTSLLSDLKSQITGFQKQEESPYTQQDLVGVLSPDQVSGEDFIYTEHITTVVVVVSKTSTKDFLMAYSKCSAYVVPESAKLVKEHPGDGSGIYRVLVFKKYEKDFRSSIRLECKAVPRDFVYSSDTYAEFAKIKDTLQRDFKKQETLVYRICTASFSDCFSAMVHIKAMRCFVESVLRFGCPAQFHAFVIEKRSKTFKQKTLNKVVGNILKELGQTGCETVLSSKSNVTSSNSAPEDEEYLPYVSLDLVTVGDDQ